MRALLALSILLLSCAAHAATIPRDLSLLDQQGQPVQLKDVIDRPVILAPVYYRCPNLCGATLASLMQLVAQTKPSLGRDYRVIAYSIDPSEGPIDAREAWTAARRYLNVAPQPGDISFLTGSAATIAALSDAISFRYRWDDKTRQFDHPAYIAVAGADGVIARWLPSLGADPGDVDLALTEASQGKIGGLAARLLLHCYRFDPASGRYQSLVSEMMIGGGLFTLAALGGFIGLSLIKERRA